MKLDAVAPHPSMSSLVAAVKSEILGIYNLFFKENFPNISVSPGLGHIHRIA
jgi:hypothetical protein